jgi:hypothetical protein
MGSPKEILEFLHYHPLSSREEIGFRFAVETFFAES